MMRVEHRVNEIPELLRREVVPFDRCGKAALAVDNGGLQRVRDQSFFRPVLDAERVADALDLFRVAREEVPSRAAGSRRRGASREDRRVSYCGSKLMVQDEVAIQSCREPARSALKCSTISGQ